MARKFKTVDYEQSGQQTLTIDDCLPGDHLARFIVAMVGLLDLSVFYARYAEMGGEPYDPVVLLALVLYGYATGVFSSRKIETATYEVIPFRFIAGGLHPDHDTIATFRKTFLAEIKVVFAQVLLVAQELGYLKLGHISLDGSKVHADASKSHAVSYGRLLKLEEQLQREVDELLALGEQADQAELPEGLEIETELASATAVLRIGRSGCSTWRKPSVSWKRGLKNAIKLSWPNTRPSCVRGKRKPRKRAASRVGQSPSRPSKQDHVTRINAQHLLGTTLPIPSRAL